MSNWHQMPILDEMAGNMRVSKDVRDSVVSSRWTIQPRVAILLPSN